MVKIEHAGITKTKSRALFLDRDGVINVNHGFVHVINNFDFIDGVFDLARIALANNFKIVVITNQSGIGRGFYTEQQFHQLTSWMCAQFINEAAPIEKVYFSPYHPSKGVGKYKKDDFSRKPHPGMILQAKAELCLDLNDSILIGDKASDIQAGIAAGIGLNIIFGEERLPESVDQHCPSITSLFEALPFLNSHM